MKAPEVSVACLLDDARTLLDQARDREEDPTTIVMNDRLYRVVLDGKRREVETGRPVTLLGLDLEGAADVPFDRPRLR